MISQSFSIPMTRAKDYAELTKPRLSALSLLSAAVGFFLASSSPFDFPLFFVTISGTALIAGGTMALNQWMERDLDSLMERTQSRPLPSGRLQPSEAFVFGSALCAVGLVVLFFGVNRYATVIGAVTVFTYLLLYTPLKTRTSFCTIVGAVPGALPPLIGWAGASGKPAYEAWILFALVFFWQMPHFLALSWMFRKDFKNAGFQTLSVTDETGKKVARQIVSYTACLLPVSLLPSLAGLTGFFYFVATFVLGIYFLILSIRSLDSIHEQARPLFRASIIYLTLVFVLMVLDKTPL